MERENIQNDLQYRVSYYMLLELIYFMSPVLTNREKLQYTPLLRQYLSQKDKVGETLLLFRVGDFYEAFFEDAETLARELEITLTARADQGHPTGKVPMAGIPVKVLENYISKLLKSGLKVAICDQVGDKTHKGPMERKVVRILTPGTIHESEYLANADNSYLAAIFPGKKNNWGVAFADVSTAEIFITNLPSEKVISELQRIAPTEVLVPAKTIKDPQSRIPVVQSILPEGMETEEFCLTERSYEYCFLESFVGRYFSKAQLQGFGIDCESDSLRALGAILDYLEFTDPEIVRCFQHIQTYEYTDYMQIDQYALRNLEIFQTIRSGEKKGSLFGLMEPFITTKMATRLMKKWLSYPLIDLTQIKKRQEAVAILQDNPGYIDDLKEALKSVSDLERLSVKLENNRLTPRELGFLRDSLRALARLLEMSVDIVSHEYLTFEMSEGLRVQLLKLQNILQIELPIVSQEGGIFVEGYNSEIDELRQLVSNNNEWLKCYEESLRAVSGIKSLKVTYNKAQGYYIETSKSNKGLVPEEFVLKQNLTNVDRYLTDELKEYEQKVLSADAKLIALEYELFSTLRDECHAYAREIYTLSQKISQLDCLQALASMATKYQYICPDIDDSEVIELTASRHPVIEQSLAIQGQFVPNDILIGGDNGIAMILTGPNMAGKSTIMKQIALIVILAQIGSHVPCSDARIGIVDKVFTRIGASDDIGAGQSTFMVEMLETSQLLNNSSSRSLLLLDEVGRGTSTYDGVAIAWSVVEYIVSSIGARTVFATHYHELNSLSEQFSQVRNYQMTVHEEDGKLLFLHRISPGGADQSYGIQVARMAGLPEAVLARSSQIMNQMNKSNLKKSRRQLVEDCIEQVKLEL